MKSRKHYIITCLIALLVAICGGILMANRHLSGVSALIGIGVEAAAIFVSFTALLAAIACPDRGNWMEAVLEILAGHFLK